MDAVPALGQHTDAILGRYGYSTEAIAALREQGVV
jgi:crotonobetainyl-CoA:carnitine CoA-transferase CaiB-like acyl-CoA transferase